MRVTPRWLGPIAKQFYLQTLKRYPQIDLNSLAMLADVYETWRTAQQELSAHANATGLLTVETATGKRPHPAFSIQRAAGADYKSLATKLGLFDDHEPEEKPDELDNLLEEGC